MSKKMLRDRLRVHHVGAIIGLTLGLSTGIPAQAALLNFGNLPLFLGTASAPNIFFIIDDSGSMDWEVMSKDTVHGGLFASNQPDGTNAGGSSNTVKHRDANDSGAVNCGFNNGTFTGYLYGVEFGSNTYGDNGADCNTADDEAWRFRNNDFNPLYYNPNATYTPWSGTNTDGTTFGDISVTGAPDDPFLTTANQRTIDLTTHNSNFTGGFNGRTTSDRDTDGNPDGFRYYTYTDDGDGIFENGEQTEVKIRDQSATVQQNFANWFSYYRSREFVAKAAYGQLIAQSNNVRMGLATINDNGGVKLQIAEMNADPGSGNKKALLDRLYRINSNNGTPLRQSLEQAGNYLECKSTGSFFNGSCPAVPVADGGSCQQNFAVLMTDGFYNGGNPSTANADGDNNTSFDGGAYADTRSGTLADVAMNYYERDLRLGVANDVPTIPNIDEADHQHMVTYGVAFGVLGTVTADPTDNTTAFAWPNPFQFGAGRSAARIDDLRHAAYNGRGKFLSAQNPQDLITALNDALGDIGDRVGSAAAVALNSASLNTNSTLYQARFDTADWSGQLFSFPIQSSGLIGTVNWDAGNVINGQDPDTGRSIITYRKDTLTGVPFRFPNLSSTQQLALQDDPTTSTVDNDGKGSSRLDWLRGDSSNEGTGNQFRVRSSKLGDMVHSAPFFVGAPNFRYPDSLESVSYSSFVATNQNRTSVVYAGANDGMLHGFNAATGAEVLAYVPNRIYSGLSTLTDPAYVHRYYVDGTPTVGDAFINGAWKSVLVGTMRSADQSLFALDVTTPAGFTEANAGNIALWEFSDTDDADLGFVFGRVSIAKMANGKWAAIFGNGYNNSQADGNASTTGNAVLFILFLEEGTDGAWTAGEFIKIDTGAGSVATPNGLASAAPIDINGDIVVDFIYAGDLEGNMWKFDVTSTNPSNWKVDYNAGTTPLPLFTACTDTTCSPTNRQPITTRPEIGTHPAGEPGFVVYFGTGKYVETNDNSILSQKTQSFYGVWDKNESTLTAFDRSDLLEQTIVEEINQTFDTNGDGVADSPVTARISSDNQIIWHTGTGTPSGSPATTHLGWRLDLFNTNKGASTANFGERQVSDAILRNGRIIFTTLLPSTDPCTFGGSGFLMEVDAADGGRLPESPFDFNLDDGFDEDDKINSTIDANGDGIADLIPASGKKSDVGMITTPTILSDGNRELKFASGSTGGIDSTVENPGPGTTGRQSWKQLR
jgi:type IV pilus assembly protein PilY1